MVRVKATVQSGVFEEITAHGHAADRNTGANIPCAAVSALLRTAARLLELEEGVSIDGTAEKPGEFRLQLTSINDDKLEWLRGVTDYLIIGLKTIEQDFPDEITLDLLVK